MTEVLVKLDDGRSLENLEESYLTMRGFFILRVHLVQVNLLQGILFAVNVIFEKRHRAS